MALNIVRLEPGYFPNPDIGRPISNAQIFVGIIDLDPEIEANRKTVSLQEEDGTIVPIAPASQPIRTGAGGVPIFNGSPVTILTDGNYSLKVLNSSGSQIYSIPNVANFNTNIVTSVSNITELRTISSQVDDETIEMLGRSTSGDGGEGTFFWDSSDLSTEVAADSLSGVFVAPNSDLTGASGAWIRLNVEKIEVSWFGAKPDGITDNIISIQAAQDFSRLNKKPLWFGNKGDIFGIGASLNVDGGSDIRDNGATIILVQASSYVFEQISAVNGTFNFEGLKIDGANLNTGNALLYIQAATSIHISRCEITRSTTNGIWCFNNFENVMIIDNHVHTGAFNGILLEGDAGGEFGTGVIEKVNGVISRNLVHDWTAQNGIFVAHALTHVTIRDNNVFRIGDVGIEVGGTSGLYGTKFCKILDNNVFDCSKVTGGGSCILVRRSFNCISKGNYADSSQHHCIHVASSENVDVDDTLRNGLESGMKVSDSSNVNLKVRTDDCVIPLFVDTSKRVTFEVFDERDFSAEMRVLNPIDSLTVPSFLSGRIQAKIEPVITFGDAVYANVTSYDGFFFSNIYNSNIVTNGLFVDDTIDGWTTDLSSAIASGGEAVLTSAANFQRLDMTMNRAAINFSGQLMVQFDYKTSQTDALVQVFSRDGATTFSNLSETLGASPSVFSTFTRVFNASPIHPDLNLRLIPAATSGSGVLTVRNVKIYQPPALMGFGVKDMNNMT